MFNLLNPKNTKQSAYIAAEYLYSDGPFESPQHFNRYNIFGKYHASLNTRNQLTVSASTFGSKWNASGQVPERAITAGLIGRFGAIDNTEGGYTDRTNINLQLKSSLNNNASWENQLYYSRYNFRLYSNFTFFLNDSVNGDQIRQSEARSLFGYQSVYRFSNTAGAFRFHTSFSAGIRADNTKGSELSRTKNKTAIIDPVQYGDISERNAWVAADEKIQLGKWTFNLGLRGDYLHFKYTDRLQNTQLPNQQAAIISPKINIEYNINPAVQVYLKTGKGFHSNDTRVVIANSGREILPAAYGSDLGIVLKPNKNLIINAAAWYLYLQQEFVYVGDEGIIEPGGKTRRTGIDVSARYQFNRHLFADANINIAKP
jgi:TonB dependent receptor